MELKHSKMTRLLNWFKLVLLVATTTGVIGCGSKSKPDVPPSMDTKKSSLVFNQDNQTVSINDSNIDKSTITARLKSNYNIVVTPYENDKDKKVVTLNFSDTPLIEALDKIYGKHRYHFSIKGKDLVIGESVKPSKPQPETLPPLNTKLPKMADFKSGQIPVIKPDIKGAMKPIKDIKPVVYRGDSNNSMPVAENIKPVIGKKQQAVNEKLVTTPKGYHLRLQMQCRDEKIFIRNAKIAAGEIKQKQAIVGDFYIAVMDGDKLSYIATRQNPFEIHPFHHEKDIRGEIPKGGPIRVPPGEECSPFSVSLPVTSRLNVQRIQFFEYMPQAKARPPALLNQKNYKSWKTFLKPKGEISGKRVIERIQKSQRPNDLKVLKLLNMEGK